MDYEKAYNDALERAKAGKPIDEVFPELKESEDERIRKEIVRFIKESPDMGTLTTKRYEQWLAWLEKQKEQKPLSTEETELNSIAFLEQLGYTCVPPGVKQQPAEWSEEDYCIFSSILSSINNLEYFAGMPAWKVSAWLNSAFTEQKRLTYVQIIKDIAMSIPECSVILMPGGEDEALLMKLLKTLKELSSVPVKDGKTRYRFTVLIEWVEDKLNKLQKCAKSNTESNQSLMYEL